MSAKELRVAPIAPRDARALTRALHYSGGYVSNGVLHLGVFLHGRCGGVMSFGHSMDKAKTVSLVRGTAWNGFLELNRMAFADWLPRNGESRALAVAMRMLRAKAPHVEWVVSFADGTQCGDGTIYRAAGFVLTNIGKSAQIWEFPGGERVTALQLSNARDAKRKALAERYGITPSGSGGHRWLTEAAGARKLPGFMLRYVYFLNPAARARLTVTELPFSAIAAAGAGMYRGQRRTAVLQAEARAPNSGAAAHQPQNDGASPIRPLHSSSGLEDR